MHSFVVLATRPPSPSLPPHRCVVQGMSPSARGSTSQQPSLALQQPTCYERCVPFTPYARVFTTLQWALRRWDTRSTQRALPDGGTPRDAKPSPHPEPSAYHPSDRVPPPPGPSTDGDAHTPSTSQTKALPPLRTHSLPPPIPNVQALLSGSFVSINADTMTLSAISTGPNGEDGVDEEGAARTHTSDSDSLNDVLSPPPTRVVSRRRSMRSHDLFAESHVSFSDLGSLVAPQDESK